MSCKKRCWAEINLDYLANNYHIVQGMAGSADIFAVVKADAYGHGDIPVAKELQRLGAKQFAVSCVEEAMRLRSAGLTEPILILGHASAVFAKAIAAHKLIATVHSLEEAEMLSAEAVKNGDVITAHLKADTGMGRIGFAVRQSIQQAAAEMVEVVNLPGLKITGMFTHFSVADSALESDIAYTKEQFCLFKEAIALFEQKAQPLALYHCCNSGALTAYSEMKLNAVRPGIVLYGYNPSEDTPCAGLQPLLTFKATIAQVKEISAGEHLSYGRTFTSQKVMRIATVTAGYADGYPRALSNKGVCSVNGVPAPVVGRVCMDQMMIDVTGCGAVTIGDTAIIYGGDMADTVQQVAQKAGTIPHEITCGLGRRVVRIYMKNKKQIDTLNYMI